MLSVYDVKRIEATAICPLCVADEAVTPRYVSTEFDRFNSIELDCSEVVARHSDIVTWFKDRRQLDEGPRHSTSDNGAVLTVRNARHSDAGRYECRVVDAATGDVIGRRMFVVVEAGLYSSTSVRSR